MTMENKKMLAALKSAVSEALEKKRRLGQYAVMWKDNQPMIIENSDVKARMQPGIRITENN